MPDRVRVAVAGAGLFGREHLKILSTLNDIEIVGVADADLASAQTAAAQFGAVPSFSDAIALIAEVKPDGLIVASPGETHLAIALAALQAGVAVLVEKPVGINAEQGRQLAEASRHGIVLPGHVLRFSEHHRMLHEILQSSAIGRILAVVARRHRDDSHAVRYADVDPVLMTMIHDIDLALWFAGAPAESMYAVRRPDSGSRSDTIALATGRNGVSWSLSTAWTYPTLRTPPDRIEVIGEQGSVELEAGSHIAIYGAQPRVIDLKSIPEAPLAAELAYFVQCIRSRNKPTRVTAADAFEGLCAADAVLASLKSRAVVHL
jgi:predicted dehydrogenase